MTAPKPPPRTLQPAEERKIQLFLERAAPIVLVDPQLTVERWRVLAALANELDLTAEQFRSTIDDLLHRGVIRRMEVTPPIPPPLPGRPAGTASAAALAKEATEDFSLSPPGTPPPVQSSSIAAESYGAADPSSARPAGVGVSGSPFTDKAGSLPSTEKTASNRWRVEGAPVPVAAPPLKSPAETFREFARPSLAAVRDGLVTQELEQRILAHATRVLGLSAVYARHLLLDLIAERKMRLATAADVPPTATHVAEPVDPRLAEFLRAATPILAQQRGLTPQSRVLLAALARERGLTDQEVDRAIGMLAAHESSDTFPPARQERLTPFRTFVESQLKKSSRGVLVPTQHAKLVTAGEELFGLDAELASTTVREVATLLRLAVITQEQAERHLQDLLRDLLPAGTQPTVAQRDRLELEGAQWGLQIDRVANLLEAHSRRNALQLQADERFARWALWGAAVALFLVVAFLVWTSMAPRATHSSTPPPSSPPTSRPLSRPPTGEKSWLESNSDLSIAIINLRSDLPQLRATLTDLTANEAARRDTAYDTLVDFLLRQATEETRRRELSQFLSLCVAADPADASAGRVLLALLDEIPLPSQVAKLDAGAFPRMYWGVKTVANALAQARGQASRITQIAAALHRALDVTFDPSRPAADLERDCLRTLSDRLFRVLIQAAGGPLVHAATIHAALVTQATKYLEAAVLDRFNAEFLAALLLADASRWPEFEDLLRSAIATSDPLAVLKLVELYEETNDSTLRDRLQEWLLMRIPGAPPESDVGEIAAFVRRGLGITDSRDPAGIWNRLSRDAREALASSTAPPEPIEPLLADVLRLAHYATLACAFAQKESGNPAVVEWRKNGPQPPDAGFKPPSQGPGGIESPIALDRETADLLRAAIITLTSRRTEPGNRLAAFASLVRSVDSVPDLPPDPASAVAYYLLSNKSSTEHASILEQAAPLAKWNQLLVALADRVEEASLLPGQLQSLLTTLMSRDVRLAEGKEGRTAARRELLQFVLRRMDETDRPATAPTTVGENAQRLLADAFLLQARILGTTVSEATMELRDPQAIVRALIDDFLSRMAAANLPELQRRELDRLPQELIAIEFLAGSDLERLVAHDRIWLRLLALEVARREATRAGEAQELLQQLQRKDREAKHLLSQLRDGQAALLEMWLLLGKSG